jgi:hypothetical protein
MSLERDWPKAETVKDKRAVIIRVFLNIFSPRMCYLQTHILTDELNLPEKEILF